MFKKSSIVATLVILSASTQALAADRMAATDVAKIIAGSTLEGATASGVGYVTRFAADGGITVETQGYGDDSGKWWVTKDHYLCMKYNNFYNGVERCVWFQATDSGAGFKAFIQGTNEPTYFDLKK